MHVVTKMNETFFPNTTDQQNKIILRRCNLCNEKFPAAAYERFCPGCRSGSEELKFSDWLPDLDHDHYEKLSA